GVEKTATAEEIKRAFLKLAHQYHPDKNGGKDEKFKEINEAYQVLGNAEKRKQFDQFGQTFNGAGGFGGGQAGGFGGQGFGGFQNGQGFNINMDDLGDLGEMFGGLGDMFGFGSARGGQGRRRGPQRGNDIEAAMTIDFDEAVFGTEKEVTLKKKITCPKCHGTGAEPGAKIETCETCKGHGRVRHVQQTILGSIQTETTCPGCGGEGKTASQKCSECNGAGTIYDTTKFKVKIPAGVDDGGRIRLAGFGEAGEKNMPAGDLYLNIRVRPSEKFERDGDDILSQKEIGFTQAALGDKVEIETVHGRVELKIPEGTQSGTVFKLRGKGVPHLDGRAKGDHLVTVIIKTPKNLNKKQKEALKGLGI
ncbi:MAG TPA: molecular chaperone DnaJ, partial [Candidatus Methylomirabilis sp.]|nr:molecular chaperone DnaJ [Candidatus Methylomirabilis sp.]